MGNRGPRAAPRLAMSSRWFDHAVGFSRPRRGPVIQSDHGSSFIAHRFRETLAGLTLAGTGASVFSQVRIRLRRTQLGLLERFHQTLKHEEAYWNSYADPWDARQKLELFHERYNWARPHWALTAAEPSTAPARILTPFEVYVKGHQVNPPSWSRWVGWPLTSEVKGWLQKDQIEPTPPSNRTAEKISA